MGPAKVRRSLEIESTCPVSTHSRTHTKRQRKASAAVLARSLALHSCPNRYIASLSLSFSLSSLLCNSPPSVRWNPPESLLSFALLPSTVTLYDCSLHHPDVRLSTEQTPLLSITVTNIEVALGVRECIAIRSSIPRGGKYKRWRSGMG